MNPSGKLIVSLKIKWTDLWYIFIDTAGVTIQRWVTWLQFLKKVDMRNIKVKIEKSIFCRPQICIYFQICLLLLIILVNNLGHQLYTNQNSYAVEAQVEWTEYKRAPAGVHTCS